MMKKTFVWILVALAVLAIVVIGVQRSKNTGETGDINIGVLLPLTGPLAFFGGPEKDAISMAVDDVNAAGGIDGRKVQVSIEDSKASAKDGVSALQKLLLGTPLAVVTSLTTVSNATLPILRDAKVPQIALSIHPDLVTQSEYAVRPYAGYEDEIKLLVRFASARAYKRVAVLWVMVPECEAAVNRVLVPGVRQSGGQVVASESFNFGAPNAKAQLTKIAAAKPDLILVMDFGTLIGSILKDSETLGLRQKVVVDLGILTSPPIDKQLLEGVRIVSPAFAISPTSSYTEFARRFKERTKGEAIYDVAYTYDAMNVLFEGIRRSKGKQADLIPAIRAMGELEGVTGTMRMNPDGNVSVSMGFGVYRNGSIQPLSVP